MELLQGRKTFIVAIVMVLYAIVIEGWVNHNWQPATALLLQAGGLGALRSAISKVE